MKFLSVNNIDTSGFRGIDNFIYSDDSKMTIIINTYDVTLEVDGDNNSVANQITNKLSSYFKAKKLIKYILVIKRSFMTY